MTQKLLALLLAAVCFTLCLCGCESTPQEQTEQLLQTANNETVPEDILTKQYAVSDFADLSFGDSLLSVNQAFPIQILRCIPSVYLISNGIAPLYAVYATQEGGRMYLFFREEYGQWILSQGMYCKQAFLTNAFDGIVVGSTRDEVLQIDSSVTTGVVHPYTPDRISHHLLQDGYILSLWYDANGTVTEKSLSTFSILPQDMPQ